LKICNNFTANNIPENPASWADLDWFVRGGWRFPACDRARGAKPRVLG
jgi:hypothetical protein